MISVIIYDCIQEEMRYVSCTIKDIIALKSPENSRIDACSSQGELAEIIKCLDIEDFACIDICEKNGTAEAENIRSRYPKIRILLIADASMSPERYIIPSIMASALILRPCTRENMREKLESFMISAFGTLQKDATDVYVVETKEGITNIPYQQIYFFESSSKKIFIRLKSEEYSCYDTMEHLVEILPDSFVRCHRSFIVNKNRITHYAATDNTIRLDDGTELPVSRSYRSDIRDLVKR